MSMPQRADKWVVFGLTYALGAAWLLRNLRPGEFSLTARILIPLVAAVIVTAFYVIWCAVCPLMAQLSSVTPTPRNVRIIANSSFLVIMLVLIYLPSGEPTTVIVEEVVKRPE